MFKLKIRLIIFVILLGPNSLLFSKNKAEYIEFNDEEKLEINKKCPKTCKCNPCYCKSCGC